MMGSLSEEDDLFFDTREEIASVSDSGSECQENLDCGHGIVDPLPVSLTYEVWIKNPGSIHERRNKFLRWMGLSVSESEMAEETTKGIHENEFCADFELETDRIMEDSGAVLGSIRYDEGLSSSQSSISCWSSDGHEFSDGALEENLVYRIKNLDDGTEFIVDELGQDGRLKMLREVGSNRLITVDEFEKNLGLTSLVQRVMGKKVEEARNRMVARKQVKRGWLKRLSRVACVVHGPVEADNVTSSKLYPVVTTKNNMVKVRSYKKHTKELTALYMGQDMLAHKGSILTMKFSPDGKYLASAGEDGMVRVWQVMETERSPEFDMLDRDPSCAYFRINNLSEIVPLHTDKVKRSKLKSMRQSDSACVIFPHKVFSILEKPLHEFHGHSGEVLDLSWSKNKCLLSSSIDKTVRLWQVGYNQCLRVFSHNNYVTSVQFNPLDDNYFVSGSIDGKVRIWAVSGCQVVDWTDIRDIVTAVCYQPDGKGVIVGSMTGNCRFYDASDTRAKAVVYAMLERSMTERIALVNTNWYVLHGADNRLKLCSQIFLQSKKKSPSKRITGFQFSPSDPSKLMVTSADSQVRILNGADMICKFRGLHSAGSQISASFASDGMHVVSASEDSHVHVWNYVAQDGHVPTSKNNWSCERFFSNNTSVAIPWRGMTCDNSIPCNTSAKLAKEPRGSLLPSIAESSRHSLSFSSPDPDHFSVSHCSLPRGCATWPEEKLPPPSSLVVSSAVCKSQYKFLKTSCQNSFNTPNAWGMVIVTAGWDGRIRWFQNYGLPIRV